jgi:hypothetical protein
MSRELFHSLEVIRSATEEIRRERWSWHGMREAQILRWRVVSPAAEPERDAPSPFSEQLDRIYGRYR